MDRKLNPRYAVPEIQYVPAGWREATMPTLFRAKGCERCENKGFTGRIGIYELLLMDDTVGGLILQKSDAQSIKRAAQGQGMDSLRDDGARKVFEGRTTVEEVVAATQEDILLDV